MIKVALVEDNEASLNYLNALLGGSQGFEIVGAYATGNAAIAGMRQQPPEVAIVDIGLPDISGIEVIRALKKEHAQADIMAYTLYEDRTNLFAALKAGASGYILKDASALEIIDAIEALVKGGAPMSPKIARYVFEELQAKDKNREEGPLSARELEVLEGIACGLVEKQLAENLSLSPHTIHAHMKNIYKKLHVKSQREAVQKARHQGII